MPAQSVFDPGSPQAKIISDLLILTLVLGLGVFILICGIIVYAMVRSRRESATTTGEPLQVTGNTRLEITWTAIPFAIVLFLFGLTVWGMQNSDPQVPAQQKTAVDVEVVGHQWWWEYRYPKLGIVTANEIHLPIHTQMYFSFQSADVLHDFWVPTLGRKIDIEPEQVNHVFYQIDTVGVFDGACAEYCGEQHAWMRIKLHAQTQADFDAWVAQQKAAPPAPAANSNIARGQQVFLANTCVNCHNVNGTAANSRVAPDLTHFGSRQYLGSGVVENNPANLARWILEPDNYKPRVHMPGYAMSDEDLKSLVAYLEALK